MKKTTLTTFLFVSTLLSSFSAVAGYKSLSLLKFSEQEQQASRQNAQKISDISASCLQEYYSSHLEFYKRHGFSRFYGNRKFSRSQIQRFLQSRGKRHLLKQMEDISCVDLTRRCLKRGFAKVGMQSTWKKIDKFTVANGVGGTAMIFALQKIGWKVLYWNPTRNTRVMEKWDDEDFALNGARASMTKVVRWQSPRKNRRGQFIYNPVWGMHAERFNTVKRTHMYYLNPVDDSDTLVGFEDRAPDYLDRIPFFVGIAHAGYHVFPGYNGKVIEAHSTRALTSIHNLEKSTFNPLGQGGGPRWTRTERYRSGLIAVPPGH